MFRVGCRTRHVYLCTLLNALKSKIKKFRDKLTCLSADTKRVVGLHEGTPSLRIRHTGMRFWACGLRRVGYGSPQCYR
jgi:hypothetical protein